MKDSAAGKIFFSMPRLSRRFWILGALAAAVFVPLAAGTGRVYFYQEKGQSGTHEDSGYGIQIPNSFTGLSAEFSLPHQNRPGDSFWLHLSLSCRAEAGGGPYTLKIRKLAVRDEQGPVLLEARLSSNPDLARAVHYEEGALTGLRPFTFAQVFMAGIPFELAPVPKDLFLEYDFTLQNAEGQEEELKGVFALERASSRRFRLSL